MSCCTNTYSIGCYGSCGVLTIPFAALQSGEHTIEAEMAGVVYTQTFTAAIGENFQINLSEFNESATYIIKIRQPDETYFTKTIDSVEYECFELKTKIVYATNSTGDYNIDYNSDHLT